MRVPACAILGLLSLGACSESAEDAPLSAALSCDRAAAPAAIDPKAGSWQLVVPKHEANEFGVPQQVFDLVDGCESFVSLSHSVGRGGKAQSNGQSELLTSTHGEVFAKRTFGLDNAFRDVAHGGGKWVAVGHGTQSPGAIAVADSLDASAWREVFQSDGMYFNSVAYGANTFVAVTNNGVATSRDGEQWRWADVPGGVQYFDVAFGDGHFVLAGVGASLSSSDGQSWRKMTCQDDAMCQPPNPPPASACEPGAICSNENEMTPEPAAIDQLALQVVRFTGKTFFAFGASGKLESSDASTFHRSTELADAAIGGVLVRMLRSPNDTPGALISVSEDGGSHWEALPYEIVEAVDCRDVPCV
ncbi:MAG TPA: hypothetical protein VMF89_28525, partial [Polyangiales bacterium]|nr:hypothetical protein [Polyangiales bacterium]